jgi:hypothetical protein
VETGDPAAPLNTDGNGPIDALDDDSDGDFVSDADEAGDTDLGTPPVDTDGDALPDYRDTDSDNDGVLDATDNCRIVSNADQMDTNGDGAGDVLLERGLRGAQDVRQARHGELLVTGRGRDVWIGRGATGNGECDGSEHGQTIRFHQHRREEKCW